MNSAYIFPGIFQDLPVLALFTTREVTSTPEHTARDLGFSGVYMPLQKHTDIVVNADISSIPQVADAVITSKKGLALGVRTADCVPILLYDTKQHVAGAVHAGWRGTAAGILGKAISLMKLSYGTWAGDLLMAVGPSIRGCCYEVGQEVIEAVERATGTGGYRSERNGKTYIDLVAANRLQALGEGVESGRIWTSPDCTKCLPERYHSYRFSNENTGRQFGLIALR